MRARAELGVIAVTSRGGRQITAISRLRSDGPVVLRPTIARRMAPILGWDLIGDGAAWISRAAGAAAPLGGDELELRIDVGPAAAVILHDVSASLALPGPHGEESVFRVMVRVAAGATLVWLPQPLIAAHDCRHRAMTSIDLAPGARLLVREELILGRHGEEPGSIRQRLRVCLAGRALYDQEIGAGPTAAGWGSAAILAGRRAVGCAVVVDPAWESGAAAVPQPRVAMDSALLPLAGPGVVVSALAGDALTLRSQLDASLAELQVGTGIGS